MRDSIVGPRLISPSGETVYLAPGEPLLVKWSRHESVDSGWAYYDLRIYKGYQRLQSAVLYREKLDKSQDRATLDAGLFQDGEVYTWALRKVYDRIGNSEWSCLSFTVKRQPN
jgi:hypothetical protein